MIHTRRHGNTLHGTTIAKASGEAAARNKEIETEIENEQKQTYMEFICRLMARMDRKGLERMLDAAGGMKMNYKEAIVKLLDKIEDEALLRRVWKILMREAYRG